MEERCLRDTFNRAAALYHQARPRYPEELFDALVAAGGLKPGDRLLEVGCGTGIATLSLAERGFRLTCVEIGADLVQEARRNLADHANVCVEHGGMEDWTPTADAPFHLVFATTAWKWVEPAVRYQRAWELLRPGGHLAFWSATHVFPDGGDSFFEEIQEVYDEIGEGTPSGVVRPRPGDLSTDVDQIEASGLFRPVLVREFDWEIDYDAGQYLRLLDTFSNHIAMQPSQRERLYSEIRKRLAERPGGKLQRGWGAVLHVAQRLDDHRGFS